MLRFSSDSLRCGWTVALLLAFNYGCAEASTPSGLDTGGAVGNGVNGGGSTSMAGNSSATAGNSSAGNAGSAGGGSAGGGSAGGGSAGGGSINEGNAGAGLVGEGSAGTGSAGTGPGSESPINIPWDWAGIVGTGQSLAVGERGPAGGTPDGTVRSTTQPFNNLKLSTGNSAWPVDPNAPALAMVPLIEPIGRPSMGYPSSWPTNIAGETPHAAMANQITTLVKGAGAADYISVHTEVGENGQCLSFLVKGAMPTNAMDVRAHAFEGTLVEARAITRLAQAAGKTYGVGAITVTHGECDAGNGSYAAQLHQLWSDYKTDLSAITGQTQAPLLIVSQQNSGGDRAASMLAQWKIGVDYPADAVCSGPKYQYRYTADHIHLVVEGYEQLGEKYAQVYYERVVRGRDWHPLEPIGVQRDGRVIRVQFHVPVAPLAWEETFQAPHQTGRTEWSMGKGFEVRGGGGNIGISSVEIEGDVVNITAAADLPATGVTVGYAVTGDGVAMTAPFAGTMHWGQLRDSDPFVGSTTQKPQPNFAVSFELPVPNG